MSRENSSAVDPTTDTPLRVALDVALWRAGMKTYWNDKLDVLEAAVNAVQSEPVELTEPLTEAEMDAALAERERRREKGLNP
jgi:hypothetical protein